VVSGQWSLVSGQSIDGLSSVRLAILD